MTEINANMVLEAINEKITKVLEFPSTVITGVEAAVALTQLRDLRNEIMLMIKVREFYVGKD